MHVLKKWKQKQTKTDVILFDRTVESVSSKNVNCVILFLCDDILQ